MTLCHSWCFSVEPLYPPIVKKGLITPTAVTFDITPPEHIGGIPLIGYYVEYKQRDEQWDGARKYTFPSGE